MTKSERIHGLQLQITNLNKSIALIVNATNTYGDRVDSHADAIQDQGAELVKLRYRIETLELAEAGCICDTLGDRVEQLEAAACPDNSYSSGNEENMTITPEPARFGPQTDAIEAFIARAGTLTPAEIETLAAARGAVCDAVWDGAWIGSWAAARDAVLAASRGRSWAAARDAVLAASVLDATWAAVLALVARDLIGQHGFTQEHYDLLTGPWATTIGKVHPDDPDRMPRAETGMAEPGNVGAVVVDAFGDKWARIKEREFCWINKNRGEWNRWNQIPHPLPFQNVVLTADDPEPPSGSVIIDRLSLVWEVYTGLWFTTGGEGNRRWPELAFPVTLIHRGEGK